MLVLDGHVCRVPFVAAYLLAINAQEVRVSLTRDVHALDADELVHLDKGGIIQPDPRKQTSALTL